jgi:hypothetical protein
MDKTFLNILTFLAFVIPFKAHAGEIPPSLHSETKRIVVAIQLKDSLAKVEYCHSNITGVWLTRFDTLKLSHNKYIGKFSEIEIRDKKFLFKPGNINLTEGQPDSSFHKFRRLFKLSGRATNQSFIMDWRGFD